MLEEPSTYLVSQWTFGPAAFCFFIQEFLLSQVSSYTDAGAKKDHCIVLRMQSTSSKLTSSGYKDLVLNVMIFRGFMIHAVAALHWDHKQLIMQMRVVSVKIQQLFHLMEKYNLCWPVSELSFVTIWKKIQLFSLL